MKPKLRAAYQKLPWMRLAQKNVDELSKQRVWSRALRENWRIKLQFNKAKSI